MNREELFYLIPYILCLTVTLGIFIYTWMHSSVRGANVYTWFVGGQALTIFGFILELISPSLETKLLWDKFQWMTDTYLVILPFLIFSIQFSEHKIRRPYLTWAFLVTTPILFSLALLTDNLHHLIYPNPHLSPAFPFSELKYDFTAVVYMYALLYVYGANFYGISLLMRRAFQPHNTLRLQYLTITLGFIIPIALSIPSLFGIYIVPQRDITPFSFAIGNLVVAWGIFRYRVFDLVPIARERVLENMTDAIIVLDASNRVMDINQATLAFTGKKSKEMIGHPVQDAYAAFPDLINHILSQDETTLEMSVGGGGEELIYEFSISPIYGRQQGLIGKAVVAHDVTKRKILESGYRQLSEELEQRVRERTDKLLKSEERYRAVVENAVEGIFQSSLDGRFLSVNPAMALMYGYDSPEDMLNTVMDISRQVHVHPGRRREFLALLESNSRVDNFENENFRKDGSIIWTSTNARAVHNESWKIQFYEGFVTDITGRKKTEQALRDSEEKFRLAFQTSPDCIIITRLSDGKIIEANDGFSTITGYTKEEAIGMTTNQLELWANPLDREKLVAALKEKGFVQNFEFQRKMKDERMLYTSISASLFNLNNEPYLLSILGDINDRKISEKALQEAYDATIEGWSRAMDLRDKETEGHTERVTELALKLARAMNFPNDELIHLRRGGLLHDMGKLGVSDSILLKPGKLTDDEWQVMRLHPRLAHEMLSPIPYLKSALDVPYCHHEKWDGSGYPRSLKGEEIPLSARIFAIVDVWDALTSERPYRKAWTKKKTLQYIQEQSGLHFDPQIVKAFLKMMQ